MWVLPLLAAAVAFTFAWMLGVQFARRRHAFQLLWAIALVTYGVASLALMLGARDGWSETEYQTYWALGAVLNVPFLAAGELVLLFRQKWVVWASWLFLVFSVAFTVSVLRGATMDTAALAEQLPSGKEVFGAGTAAHRLPQLFSYPAYFVLVAGTLWSAWKMRGHAELKERFVGTLLIAIGATIVAGGATFAALGILTGFVLTLVAGIAVMFWGFLRASKPVARS